MNKHYHISGKIAFISIIFLRFACQEYNISR